MIDTPEYRYDAIFDDREHPALRRRPAPGEIADRASPTEYVFDDEIRLAVNLALATGRPLLVAGGRRAAANRRSPAPSPS